ncbi:MAG: VPLPA-CTERM sorting domain-containing protein [Gammaproteobacteria bacterium]
MKRLLLCVLVLVPLNINATIVSYKGEGILTSVDSSLASRFSLGDAFSFVLSYDSAVPDNLSNPTFGQYLNSVTSIIGNVDGYEFSFVGPSDSLINIPVGNVFDLLAGLPNSDGFSGLEVNSLTPQFANIPLKPLGNTLADDSLLQGPFPETSAWDLSNSGSNFRLRFGDIFNENEIEGSFTSITSVPVPAAFWMLSSALLALIAFRRGKRAKH